MIECWYIIESRSDNNAEQIQEHDNVEDELFCVQLKKEEPQLANNMDSKYEFRSIQSEEADQAVRIEQICFPPNEACSEKCMKERIAKVPELFLVAVDRETGKLAGFFNGLATDEPSFRDEFFTDVSLYSRMEKTLCC